MQDREEIFVFGSNLAGVHGAGAAKFAVKHHGAIYGEYYGMQGKSFAIPTKDENIETMSLKAIKAFVDKFIDYAYQTQSTYMFNVTAIGCGLAGYTAEDIAPMFEEAPDNCRLPFQFEPYLINKDRLYWNS